MSQAAILKGQARLGSDYYFVTLQMGRADSTPLRRKVEAWRNLTVMALLDLARDWRGVPETERKGGHLQSR